MKVRSIAPSRVMAVPDAASNGSVADRATEPSMPTSTAVMWSATTLTPIARPASDTSPSRRAGRPPCDGLWSSSIRRPSAMSWRVCCVMSAGDTPSSRARSARDVGPLPPM